MVELKPCPFCGECAVHINKAYGYYCDKVIYCENCDILFSLFSLDDCKSTDEQLIEAWNRRADNG